MKEMYGHLNHILFAYYMHNPAAVSLCLQQVVTTVPGSGQCSPGGLALISSSLPHHDQGQVLI